MLIVVLIIGILAAIALPQYRQSVDKSRFSIMMTTVQSLAQAAERYYMAQGAYTTNPKNLDVTFNDAAISGSKITFSWGYCSLFSGEVGCWNIKSLKNFYTHYYRTSYGSSWHNKNACVALTGTSDDARWQKICTNLGGTTSFDTSCVEGACRVFFL